MHFRDDQPRAFGISNISWPHQREIFRCTRTCWLFLASRLSINQSEEHLLYLALYWRSHFNISAGHLILAINTWIAHWRAPVAWYFLCIQQMNGWMWTPAISEHLRINGVVGLVYDHYIVVCWSQIIPLNLHIPESLKEVKVTVLSTSFDIVQGE